MLNAQKVEDKSSVKSKQDFQSEVIKFKESIRTNTDLLSFDEVFDKLIELNDENIEINKGMDIYQVTNYLVKTLFLMTDIFPAKKFFLLLWAKENMPLRYQDEIDFDFSLNKIKKDKNISVKDVDVFLISEYSTYDCSPVFIFYFPEKDSVFQSYTENPFSNIDLLGIDFNINVDKTYFKYFSNSNDESLYTQSILDQLRELQNE